MLQPFSRTFQARRTLIRFLAPRYLQASPVQKTLLLDACVKQTGYTRKYAIELLNHSEHDQQSIQRRRLPQYRQVVQQALFLAWKATHYVCAKRLHPSLPSLVALLERQGSLELTEEERRQVLAMSVSTAERYLHTQHKPSVHALSTTTPGLLSKSQLPVCLFSPWEEDRPGFVEIDTDSGSEFLTEEMIAYCEQERLTFTRGRQAVKNDQAHVEQKNGAVVREAVGCVRLVGRHAHDQLREVYRALRLVVNCLQPSLKLQVKVRRGEQVRRVYDTAQTPLQRLLVSGVLPEDRQRDLHEWVQQIDPLALSEYLDALRHALLCIAHLPPQMAADGTACPLLSFSLAACTCVPRLPAEKRAERTDHQEKLTRSEEILNWPHTPYEPSLLEKSFLSADQQSAQARSMDTPAIGTASTSTEVQETCHLALTTLEQAIAAYVEEMRASGRNPKTVQWHQTSLGALRRYVWQQFQLTELDSLTGEYLRSWLTTLSIAPSPRTRATRTVNTVAAYARSARAFCNWLVRQGYVPETLFPQDAVPKAQRSLPQAVTPKAFVRLLRACQLQGPQGGQRAAMAARNRAILWLLLDTGLQVSELCSVRLADVDRASGIVTVCGKKGHSRTFFLSADGQRAVGAYLEQFRLTKAWEPAVPEAQEKLLLTERRRPLTKNGLSLLFQRLSQRAGFTRTPICPSMLRDTYAIHFLQAGGRLEDVRKQLGVADLASVKRYQHFCEQRKEELQTHRRLEEAITTQQSQ